MIYFDNAATTLPLDISLEAFSDIERNCYYNTSSNYILGQKSKLKLEEARSLIANTLKIDTNYYNVIFTSGASESNSIMMLSCFKKARGRKVIISSAEHKSIESNSKILNQHGYDVFEIKSKYGYADSDELSKFIDKDTYLISIIHTNNVVGSINDISDLCKCAKSINPDLIFHSDITQSIGKPELSFEEFKNANIDAFSFSSHKCYAPKGVGALVIKKGINPSLSPLGGQEKGIRGGTHSLGLIVAFSRSIEYLYKNFDKFNSNVEKIYSAVVDGLKRLKKHIHVLSVLDKKHSSNILSFAIDKLPGEVAQRIYFDNGIALGTSSACSSNSPKNDKNILLKMGYDSKIASSALRVSFSIYNTLDEVEEFLSATKNIISKYCA